MHLFAHPERLWLGLALIPWAALAAFGSRRRDRDWRALGQSGRPGGDGSPAWLLASAFLVPALAQPRWGRLLGEEAPAGHDVVLLVDVSRSMAAEDAVPDRIGLATGAALDLLRALGDEAGDRAGVVAFAGRGSVRCPLTEDLDAAAEAVRSLRPGDVQPGGTDLGAGIETALEVFDEEDHAEGRTIVVFSDGEDHVGGWSATIDRLRARGVMVHAVAIGDPERGHPVPRLEAAGASTPADVTRRSDVALAAIARATGGAVIPLGLATADLGSLYRDRIGPTARRRRDELRLPERVERFPAFVVTALAVGLAGSSRARTRRRGRRSRFAAGLVLAGLVAGSSLGASKGAATAASLVAEGVEADRAGRFAEALRAFEAAITLDPGSPIPRYDAAAALFRLRRYPEAIARYGEARDRADEGLRIKIDYALGNAHLALGEAAGSLAHYDACLASNLPGPALDAIRRDAAENRAYAATRIKPPPEEPDRGDPGPGGRDRRRGEPGGDRRPGDGPREPGKGGRSRDPGGGRSRGPGGSGGGGQAPPEDGSPESRLEAALRDVREARDRREPEPTPKGSGGSSKDW